MKLFVKKKGKIAFGERYCSFDGRSFEWKENRGMGEVVLDESDSLYTNKVVCFVLVLMKCLNAK